MRYFLPFIGSSLLFIASLSYGQKQSYADSVLISLKPYLDTEKIDSLISLAHFPVAKNTMAKECVVFAQEAKRLALKHNLLDKYAKALELEGVALGAIGKKVEGIDSIKKSLTVSKNLNNTKLLAEGYFSLGNLYKTNDNLPDAIASYKLANEKYNLLENDPNKNIVTNNLAIAYFHSGNFTEALNYYLQDVLINKQTNDEIKLAKNYGNLSLVYKTLKNYDKANYYVQQAILIQKKTDQKFNLSISYLSAGNIKRKLKQYDSAFYFNKAALNISKDLKDTIGIAFAYANIASVYFSKKEYANAIINYFNAAKLFEQQQYTSKVLGCYSRLSTSYRLNGEYSNALIYANRAYIMAKKLNNMISLEEVTEALYKTYYELNNYKQALIYRDLNVAYKDSLINEEKIREIAKIETSYEIKSRDSEIALLNKNQEIAAIKAKENKQIKYFLIIIAALLIVIIAVVYNRYLAQKKIKFELAEANTQLKELNASKNKFFAIIAHDLRNPITAFNNLTSALVNNFKQLTEEQLLNYLENLKKSSEQFNGLLENLLQWALSQTSTLNIQIKEFDLSDLIQKNIDLLTQNALQKNISLSFDNMAKTKAYADPSTIDIVFRNIISNAIKFSNNDSQIKIRTTLSEKNIEISIQDEGIGMTAKEIEMLFDITKDTTKIGNSPEKGNGLGLLLSNEYIKKSSGEIRVLSKANKGTTFIIKLPRTQQVA